MIHFSTLCNTLLNKTCGGKKKSLPKCYFPSKNLYLEQRSVFLDMNLWKGFYYLRGMRASSNKRQDLLSPGDGSTADDCQTNSSPRFLFGDKTSLILHIGIKSGFQMCSERGVIPWGLVTGALPHEADTGHPLGHSLCQRQQSSHSQACCNQQELL